MVLGGLIVGGRGLDGDGEAEGRAGTPGAVHPDVAAHGLDQALADVEAKPGTADAFRLFVVVGDVDADLVTQRYGGVLGGCLVRQLVHIQSCEGQHRVAGLDARNAQDIVEHRGQTVGLGVDVPEPFRALFF